MGIAAYNRGTERIRKDADARERDPAFILMEELNAIAKHPNAARPFGPIVFVYDGRSHWHALDPNKRFSGFGYWYRTLREAVSAWRVQVIEYRNGEYYSVPN